MNRETFSITLLNGLAQGTTQNERIGNRVVFTNIGIQGSVEGNMDSAGVCDPGLCAIWLVYDKQPTGELPKAADFLQWGVAPVLGTGNPSSEFLNMANAQRFVVLKKYLKTLGPWEKGGGNTGYAYNAVDTINWHLSVELQTLYDQVGDSIANITTGAIYLCSTCDVRPFDNTPGQINNDYKLLFHSRLRFKDNIY